MSTHVLMPDTQAILLLCASFGQHRQEPQPLKLSEYNQLTNWLRENGLRPADLLSTAGKDRLLEIAELNPDRLVALLERGVMLGLAVESWTSKGIWVLGRSDSQYPKRLKKHLGHLAPAILYGVGKMELLSAGGLAVVGSRDVDAEALAYTQKVAETCAAQGIQVVSGGARGIDQAAMLGVLTVGGTTVGVLADSLTKASVAGKYRLGIREGRLTLVSAYDPDAGFNVGNAMGRNKFIYGLADYALIVSSAFGKGGTWAGAVEAQEQIKDVPVFVRTQGNIPEGNRELVNKGAKPFPEEPCNSPLRALLDSATWENYAAIEALAIDATSLGVFRNQPSDRATTALYEVDRSRPKDIYEAVTPFILEKLEQPQDAKSLAECLNVRQGQMQDWLKRASAEGKVKKTKNLFVVNRTGSQLSLLPEAE